MDIHQERNIRLQDVEEELQQRMHALRIWKAQRIQEIEELYSEELEQTANEETNG